MLAILVDFVLLADPNTEASAWTVQFCRSSKELENPCMNTEQLRTFLFELLASRDPRSGDLQFNSCILGVSNIANEQCPEQLRKFDGRLSEEDCGRLKHVIWDLILERVLIPGSETVGSSNEGWPWLALTEHGRRVVAERKPVPYDPDGYLARLRRAGIHVTIERYLQEAVGTFRTGNYLASAVMLGAAAEWLIIELCEAIAESFANVSEKNQFNGDKRAGSWKISLKTRAVNEWFKQKKAQLPVEWQRPEQTELIDKIAGLIRSRRNDAGHPQNPPTEYSHEEAYALLMVFPDFCEKLYELKAWLSTKRGLVS
jgi:hypothetical protein